MRFRLCRNYFLSFLVHELKIFGGNVFTFCFCLLIIVITGVCALLFCSFRQFLIFVKSNVKMKGKSFFCSSFYIGF